MNRNIILSGVVLLLTLGTTLMASAQPIKYAQAGMSFLKIDVGARAAALAGTQAGITGDASAMFFNPAGLAFIEGFDAMTSVTSWLVDTKHYGVGAAYRMGNIGTFGFGMVWMDYGSFRRTVPYDGDDQALRNQGYLDLGEFHVNEYALGLSYARQITTQFYVGGQIKYATQNLGEVEIYDEFAESNIMHENEVSNIVMDFGLIYYTGFRDLRLGASIRNFSNQADYLDQRFELPLTLDFGIAMDLFNLAASSPGEKNSSLVLAVDWLHPRDYSERLHVGLEYSMIDAFFVRGGYKFNYDEEGLSAGLGVKTGLSSFRLSADYAYTAFGDFGQVHRISFGIGVK